jgi:hypothetical protein
MGNLEQQRSSTFVPLTDVPVTSKLTPIVAKWNVAPSVSVFLLGILILIGLIQVLPQVDLPDTAFHEDTAPVVVKFRVAAAPVTFSAILTVRPQISTAAPSEFRVMSIRPIHDSGNLVPILHCSLLC